MYLYVPSPCLDDNIRAATEEVPAPPGGPQGRTYIPTSLQISLLDSVHASPGSGHPGRQRTLPLLEGSYWWPNMAQEVAQFVKGCSVCAIISTLRCLPEGKLVPLPIPRQPWSHLGVDFATDLPASNDFTTILVVVDRFSGPANSSRSKVYLQPLKQQRPSLTTSSNTLAFQRT